MRRCNCWARAWSIVQTTAPRACYSPVPFSVTRQRAVFSIVGERERSTGSAFHRWGKRHADHAGATGGETPRAAVARNLEARAGQDAGKAERHVLVIGQRHALGRAGFAHLHFAKVQSANRKADRRDSVAIEVHRLRAALGIVGECQRAAGRSEHDGRKRHADGAGGFSGDTRSARVARYREARAGQDAGEVQSEVLAIRQGDGLLRAGIAFRHGSQMQARSRKRHGRHADSGQRRVLRAGRRAAGYRQDGALVPQDRRSKRDRDVAAFSLVEDRWAVSTQGEISWIHAAYRDARYLNGGRFAVLEDRGLGSARVADGLIAEGQQGGGERCKAGRLVYRNLLAQDIDGSRARRIGPVWGE